MSAQFSEQPSRPPYVLFEIRAVEDRDASITAGSYVAKDVDFAIITPQGSKDRIERVATEWLTNLEQQAREKRIPDTWVNAFRGAYKAWKAGNEIAVIGTDIRAWPVASPAQVKILQGLHVRTVEDFASCNEETINRMGMGGRALKTRAEEWLKSANSIGKHSEALAALKTENESLRARNSTLEDQVSGLAKRLDALEYPKEKVPQRASKDVVF